MRSPLKTAWGSLTPPRLVSLMAASTYSVLGVLAVTQLAGPSPVDITVGAAVMLAGAMAAAPAAWRGWWGVEVPAAGLVMIGLSVDTLAALVHVIVAPGARPLSLVLSAATMLLLCQRLLRIWGHDWEPGRQPDTALTRAQARVTVARTIGLDTTTAEGRTGNEQQG